MEVLLLFFILFQTSYASIANMGKCKQILDIAVNMDFKKFSTEKGGFWNFQLVPNTKFSDNLEKMWLVNKPTEVEGVYDTTIYYKTTCGAVHEFINEKVSDFSCGQATATSKDSDGNEQNFKITFTDYVPGKFASYYVCSDDGGDETTDYRYVLTHEKMCADEIERMMKKDKQRGFNNELKKITV